MNLELKNITKKYTKDQFALNNVSLSISTGIVGLLGPNGAGKSTLFKIISTLNRPTSGTISFCGHDIVKNPNILRKTLGYLPQEFGVYPNLNAFEFLEYIAALKGVGHHGLKKKITKLLEEVNLIDHSMNPLSSYSGGMKQRIGIVQALLNDPKVLILDEPTVGLDPLERLRFKELILELGRDRIIFLSSHIINDIENAADHVIIMNNGELLAHNTTQEIIKNCHGLTYEIIIDHQKLGAFKDKNIVVNSNRKGDFYNVRYLSHQPKEGSIEKKACLEDAYTLYTNAQRNV